MTNPFTAYPFATADNVTSRTLPARFADIKNVKDFGALGDGTGALLNTRYGSLAAAQVDYPFVTDIATQSIDWAAITAAVNWTTSTSNRGLIYFPPGTYIVSQPIDYSNTPNPISNIIFRGEIGLSTVVGNFADYVFRRQVLNTAGDGGVHNVEGLTVVNNHATGGGIRIGFCVGAAVRDCIVTANLGINTASDDTFPGGVTSQEVTIENCTLSPGTHASGSRGILSVSDGPIANCIIVGFEQGIIGWGQQGCQNILGCHIELCGTGVHVGMNPGGGTGDGDTCVRISGCYFKNCGTAIAGGGSMRVDGIYIEAATGTIAGDPQYGINGSFGACMFAGISVTGAFQQYGISLSSGQARHRTEFYGVQVTNTAGLGNWDVQSPSGYQFVGCNYALVDTLADLPAFLIGINTEAWVANGITALGAITAGSGGPPGVNTYTNVALTGGSGSGARANIQVFGLGPVTSNGGVVQILMVDLGSGYVTGNTLSAASGDIGGTTGFSVPITAGGATTLDLFFNISGFDIASPMVVTVAGATPSGYDGKFSVLAVGTFTKIQYPQSNPGSSTGTLGTAIINYNDNALEGLAYNISDGTNGLNWGDIATATGTHTTHYKVRWNGTNWIVVGK